MKVLMLHDCAFVGFELGKELMRQGFTVSYMEFVSKGKLDFYKTGRKLAKVNADLVHAHYCRSAAYASYLSGKPYIIHCHGSDVRNGLSFWQKKALKKSSKVLVATRDLFDSLLCEEKIWLKTWYLPTPVGSQFFDFGLERKHEALYFRRRDEICQKIDWIKIALADRNFSYEEMPTILNGYEFVVDDHYPVLSKLSLEALGCGCKVIDWKGEVIKGLPKEHRVENVVSKLISIYEDALS